ncbi:P2R1A-PPP2R2A-interacting phosphatase regulator 1 isoform X4 [Ixodes scapularis]|uniref:P2R1A-PPP2R2A-interacting phosphatase regulator 1 isoform X4 n=1 Tax=Ixodes scapularis TaxID=6945 RepID=UPI001A9F8E06|nr:P2R1A-PPP2R2A-interacting phosphatase regulator 1 isoform X4 [Ixodes scapularis]XP_040359127.1 P2R1A-PPP2R2A-interacting phosphatase regulator 1 isoform X4 [Ixodes scapularis]
MDVDPTPPTNTTSNLKRSSSAPMINVLGNTPSFREALSPLLLSIPRTRRFSASFSPNHSPSSPLAAVPSRVSQIKHEEGMDVMIRETAHEKEVQSKLAISQSWDDLSLADGCLGDTSKRPRSLTDPLHIFTPPPGICNSPSPTRTGKQCFSPSMCLSSKQAFSPSPSPSPTRKAFATRRSQSPITLRPSQFSVKRKFDMDMDQGDFPMPAKRLNLSVAQEMATSHVLHHSLSQSSLEATSSPEQTVPHDMTDSLSSSSGSPCCPTAFHASGRSPAAPSAPDGSCNMEDS